MFEYSHLKCCFIGFCVLQIIPYVKSNTCATKSNPAICSLEIRLNILEHEIRELKRTNQKDNKEMLETINTMSKYLDAVDRKIIKKLTTFIDDDNKTKSDFENMFREQKSLLKYVEGNTTEKIADSTKSLQNLMSSEIDQVNTEIEREKLTRVAECERIEKDLSTKITSEVEKITGNCPPGNKCRQVLRIIG